jgi:hypothetical protein
MVYGHAQPDEPETEPEPEPQTEPEPEPEPQTEPQAALGIPRLPPRLGRGP